MRLVTTVGELARRGFADPDRAAALLSGYPPGSGEELETLVELAAGTSDPDLALGSIFELDLAGCPLTSLLKADAQHAARVVAVLGGSQDLAQYLVGHPEEVAALAGDPGRRSAGELRSLLLMAVAADLHASAPVADVDPATGIDLLRVAYRRQLLRIAARDLTSPQPLETLPDVSGELADLADAAVETALAIARAEVPGSLDVRLAIVALGKTGAQELNYISDVDVLFLAEPREGEGAPDPDQVTAIGTRLAAATTRICSAQTAAGTLWDLDAALRPEGKAGPLVRTLASHEAYYSKWAKNWEFQAMLKARPMVGDLALGQAFVDMVAPLVWLAGERPDFIAETQQMRRRVVSLIPDKEAARELKLGAGGLRDTEFSVQLLQLVHGRSDERLRLRATLPALGALVEHGYVGRSDGADLAAAYRFQRVLEHRIQLYRMRRTHLLPDDDAGLRRLARALGLRDGAEVLERWRASAIRVQRLQQRVFYSPLLEAVARIPSEEIRLTPEAASARLAALGYADPKAALRHIEALSQGMSRQAEIQRQLLPAMLGWFADGPNPDAALLAFRQVSEELGATPWYLRALRDEGAMAESMARILSASRYAVDLLRVAPQTVQLLAESDELAPRTSEELSGEIAAGLVRHQEAEGAIDYVRGMRRRELFRIAAGEILQGTPFEALGQALSDLADVTVDAALAVARRAVPGAPRMAVIAMGRWGGAEMSYGSDADAMIVVADSDDPEAAKKAVEVVSSMRALLNRPGPEPALELDMGLRPEGKDGPLARSLSSYEAYYGRWSDTWEMHALLRADFAAGDKLLGQEFLDLIEPHRFPAGGLSKQQLADIRKLKGRMEAERMPRGVDPARHVKLGPGGLSDVEWTVQVLQLQHAHSNPELRSPRTLTALRAALAAGLVGPDQAQALEQAWELAGRIRNTAMLVRGRASDTVPTDTREQAAVAELLGYGRGGASHLLDDWMRTARRAKAVVDQLFWGLD